MEKNKIKPDSPLESESTDLEVWERRARFPDRQAHGCACRSHEQLRLESARAFPRPFSQASFKTILITLLNIYRYLISPMLGTRCRFEPSCSTYAIQAIKIHGSLKGCYYAARRLMRCHPWHPGGVDPVP